MGYRLVSTGKDGSEAKMRTRVSSARFALLLVFALSPWVSLHAQQPTFLAPVEMKGQWLRGSIAVTQHENDGMIGINGKGTEAGYKIETATPGGPAASAGILPGDTILSIDGASVKGVETRSSKNDCGQERRGGCKPDVRSKRRN